MSEADPLALDTRDGLPAEFLYLREALPRDRWAAPGLHPTARHWLGMHAHFHAQQAEMAARVAEFRAGACDARVLHGRLIPTLQAFLQHLDGHHRIESGHYFPAFRRLEPRIQPGLDLLDRDHDAIHHHIDALFQAGLALHQGVASGAGDCTDRAHLMGDALDRAAPLLARHLEDEEDIVIPLLSLRGDPHA